MEREETRARDVEAELQRAALVRVVDPTSPAETSRWMAFDLASMIEGCFGARVDPDALDDRARRRWLERLGDSYEPPDPALDRNFLRHLWLLDENGEPAGTLAMPTSGAGRIDLPLWSLYVHPAHRGRGLATRALGAAHEAARRARFRAIRLDTHWVWQHSVRFYLGRRMWVVSWQHALGFSWLPDLPRYAIEESDERIVLAIEERGKTRPWLTATRDGERLVLEDDEQLSSRYGWMHAHATLATALATRGWPLIRSQERWRRRHESTDLGQVEGLAAKIQLFEALARHWGWQVRTPRIPGLTYPPLGEIDG